MNYPRDLERNRLLFFRGDTFKYVYASGEYSIYYIVAIVQSFVGMSWRRTSIEAFLQERKLSLRPFPERFWNVISNTERNMHTVSFFKYAKLLQYSMVIHSTPFSIQFTTRKSFRESVSQQFFNLSVAGKPHFLKNVRLKYACTWYGNR